MIEIESPSGPQAHERGRQVIAEQSREEAREELAGLIKGRLSKSLM